MKETTPEDIAKYWKAKIKAAEKLAKDYITRGDKVVERYRDENDQSGSRFNILWSNVQTTLPTLYSQSPRASVARRFNDLIGLPPNAPARQAAMVLERALDFHIESDDFDRVAEAVVEDYLLPGRGTARIYYEPVEGDEAHDRIDLTYDDDEGYRDESGAVIPEEAVLSDDGGHYMQGEAYRPVVFETASVGYVYWKDFLHGPARKWADVPWVAFREWLSISKFKKRFPLYADKVTATESEDNEGMGKSVPVWEIWDKERAEVVWVTEQCNEVLERSPPPLSLKGFYPCPQPLFATTTNDSLIPIPDYCQYQDQAEELDRLTARIDALVSAVRVIGVYDSSSEGLASLLMEGDNKMVPVENWAMFAEKGGVKGQVDWFPIDQVVSVLISLYEARDRVKTTLYEITGLSDLLRGTVDPREKLGQSKIKAQFGASRLNKRQDKVAKFIRDLLRLQAEVIGEHFSPQTLQLMTGIPVDQQTMEILQSDMLREYSIDIETDSTIQPDEQHEKETRIEFLQTAGMFLEKALPVAAQAPDLAPLLGQMLLFGIRGFKAGRQLEDAFEEAVAAMKQPKPPQGPSPKDEKDKADAGKKVAETQQIQAETALMGAPMGMPQQAAPAMPPQGVPPQGFQR